MNIRQENMKIKFFAVAAALIAASANAQSIYTIEGLSSEDLNGTARFVGMGGALSALGADISTMGTNPAGTGLFRHADVAFSTGILSLTDGQTFDGHHKARVSFDQAGIVYPFHLSDEGSMRYFNIGFNYHKRKNFHSLLAADQVLGEASQTWQMSDLSSFWGGNDKGTPLAVAGYQTYLYEDLGTKDDQGYEQYSVYNGVSNTYRKSTSGSVQQYDLNMSANFSDRYFFGLTVGFYNVDVDSYSLYGEALAYLNNSSIGNYMFSNDRSLSGTGVDFRLGTIIYPIEGSSFRLGLTVTSPVWYSLTANCTNIMNSQINGTNYDYRTEVGDHDFNVHTPWKFNIAAGGTIADFLALGAEYEYADYSASKLSYDNGYDDWGWNDEVKDRSMNREINHFLKGVSTLRLGAEGKFDYGISLRLGYNYVSSPIKKSAFENQFINSAAVDYATSTAYVNPGDINRYTVGAGYRGNHFYADFAYQYQQQNGEFHAFNTQRGDESGATPNDAPMTKLKLDRNQFLLTLGYKF